MAKELRPPPEPAHVDSAKVGYVGTAIWLLAFVGMLPFYGWLDDHHHLDWLWTSLAGVCVGIFGSVLAWRHRRQGRTY